MKKNIVKKVYQIVLDILRQYFYGIGLDFKLEKLDPFFFFGTKDGVEKEIARVMSGSKIEIICNDISVGSINFHKEESLSIILK